MSDTGTSATGGWPPISAGRPMTRNRQPAAHLPATVKRDEVQLSDDQLLQALAVGDVVIMYGTRRPPAGLRSLAIELAAPFTSALAAVGQAVILARRPGTVGLTGVAWTHLVRVRAPNDPLLREFIQAYLGRGAPDR